MFIFILYLSWAMAPESTGGTSRRGKIKKLTPEKPVTE